ncbi:FeS assembly SUF system protein SufT, partial [Cryobacterium sp. MLB-32]|uniref:iron-sulfur cluster assembly protein n=1 Tax=Cryobacterium sp. MLB-32 TaxID=1529318 RepID=UPI0004E70663
PVTESMMTKQGPFNLDQVLDRLKNVYDPEIPINVVDLGLIYVCQEELLSDGSHRVEVKMSMTAPGCGMGDVLKEDARAAIKTVPGVSEIDIELVWDPPWGQDRMSPAAKLQLGMY